MTRDALPKLALGTWLMGGTKEPDPQNDDAHDIAVVKTALDSGITLIDTAQNYAAGKCEELVGAAVAGYPRGHYQILTKQNKLHLSYDEVLMGCQASLQRLGLDYIDYFLCHAPNADFDMREFFRAANQLHKEGLVRHVGVSNLGPKMLQLAVETSEAPIVFNQVSFSPADSDILRTGTYDFCVEHNIAIQAYRSLVDFADDADVAAAAQAVADGHGLTLQQAAVAYLNSYQNMHFTIRASSTGHWQQLQDALLVKLPPADVEAIKQIHLQKSGKFGDMLAL
ncbi:MAG TPA: aldo/keto reductase [Candidatus Saccharimonadales bacterium]|nr:aldo/keto reductase [Candidatus Saccharimonadales bacterium]